MTSFRFPRKGYCALGLGLEIGLGLRLELVECVKYGFGQTSIRQFGQVLDSKLW